MLKYIGKKKYNGHMKSHIVIITQLSTTTAISVKTQTKLFIIAIHIYRDDDAAHSEHCIASFSSAHIILSNIQV